MSVRVFTGAIASALVLFAHSTWNDPGAWALITGFGFVLLAAGAATALDPAYDDR